VKILTHSARVAAFVLFPMLALAQGGPPFRSDDPDTPGNRHWEINAGFIGERNAFAGSYETPNIDINYGIGNRIQLKYEIPLSVAESRGDPGHVAAGLGNSLLGMKYRFYQRHSNTHIKDGEREIKFSLSIYPQLLLEKLSETTISVGGRVPIVRGHWLRLIGMGGHGLVRATPSNGQPGWIAFVGLQFLSDRRRRHGDE